MPNSSELDDLAGVNLGKPAISVRHSELERLDEDSLFKSCCPACKKGILLVRRDSQTLEVSKIDRCVLCSQLFEYEDLGV